MSALDGEVVSTLGMALHTPTLIFIPPSSNHILGINGLTNLINISRNVFYMLGTVLHDLLTHLTCIITLMR